VLGALRRFLREGTPWRSLLATADQASGATLRRCLARWAATGLLTRVHALLIRMLRGHPDLILDTCSVRAKRGGDLTGPNPTDRAKRGTKYHVAVDGDGVPVACAATAANVNDTLVFERLFLAAFAAMARIRTVFADKGYDAEHHRALCRRFGAEPRIHKRGQPRGSGLGKGAGRWSAATPGFWKIGASLCAMTGSASSSNRSCRAPAYSWLQVGWLVNSENRLLYQIPLISIHEPNRGGRAT
jgi:transposase